MNFLIFWVSTLIPTYLMKGYKYIIIFKDLADLGYKINFSNENEIKNNNDNNSSSRNMIENVVTFIPVYNLFNAYKQTIAYVIHKKEIIAKLNEENLITKLNEKEKDSYNKNKNSFKSILINFKFYIRSKTKKNNDKKITFNSIDGSTIDFYFKEDYFEIVNTEGPVSLLNNDDQTNYLANKIIEIYKNNKDKNLEDLIYEMMQKEVINEIDYIYLDNDNNIDKSNNNIKRK